jgi:hypothetical protein
MDAALRGKRKGTIHPKLELSPVVRVKGQKSNPWKDFARIIDSFEKLQVLSC